MALEWLIAERKLRGMSQAEVAQQSGIVQQSYQLIENGTNRPRPETAKRIAGILGFPWTKFYDEESEG